MNTQPPTEQSSQQLLEEKLKLHIQREFDLGEKVITLLKQKKELESSLQAQLSAKDEMEQQLAEALANRQSIEQKYAKIQQDLRAQQKSLRQRSRRFAATQEGSQEDLEALREEIRRLKQQLEILDIQKVEEHVRLSNTIEERSRQERQLKQELQKISFQKELAEEELDTIAQQFQKLSDVQEQEQAKHEKEIERLQRKQAQAEIQIAHVLDEQKQIERKLRQEIETLQYSKAELEEKLAHLQPSQNETQEIGVELLQVIEQKEQEIRELQEKAHQRSAILRAENETLRQEMETFLNAHPVLKTLSQPSTAPSETFQPDQSKAPQNTPVIGNGQRQPKREASEITQRIDLPEPEQDAEKPSTENDQPTPIHRAELNFFWPKFAMPAIAVLVVLLGVTMYWEWRLISTSPENSIAPLSKSTAELPENKYGLQDLFGQDMALSLTDLPLERPVESSAHTPPRAAAVQPVPILPDMLPESILPADLQPVVSPDPTALMPQTLPANTPPQSEQTPQPVATASKDEQRVENATPQRQKTPAPKTATRVVKKNSTPKPVRPPKTPAKRTQTPKTTAQARPTQRVPKQPTSIVVQLSTPEFLPKELQAMPTIENNSILRRYYEQKHSRGYRD